jgi:hypothetical protein
LNRLSLIAKLQGAYWALTGIWPLLHMPSFLLVTGPKTDLWLVRTVAVLITMIGLTLIRAGLGKRVTSDIVFLGIASALGLAAVDLYFALNNVISDIYLYDAAGEAVIIGLWIWASATQPKEAPPQPILRD